MGKRYRLQQIEEERGDLTELIPQLLIKYNGSQKDVATELGVSPSTISTWLRENGFVARIIYVQMPEDAHPAEHNTAQNVVS